MASKAVGTSPGVSRRRGPVEWGLDLVVDGHELIDPGDQLLDAREAAAPDCWLRDDPVAVGPRSGNRAPLC